MNLKQMTVTAACTRDNPYRFSAMGTEDTAANTVNLVMPLGGEMSGLYRSPKVGEKVLVAQVDVSAASYDYYLMGYLPSNASASKGVQPFFDMNTIYGQGKDVDEDGKEIDVEITDTYNVIKEEGQVFRYKKIGNNSGRKNEYSEIGFYKKKDSSVDAVEGKAAPTIDEIDILSAGNIFLDADNNITLKVGRSSITISDSGINLETGRSSIAMSDSGISMKNQLMRFIPNPVDATISMNAREGISIAGEGVGINAGYKWSIGEKFGAIAAGTAGSLNIGGREIRAAAPSYISQLASNAVYLFNETAKITMGGLALTSDPNESKVKNAELSQQILSGVALLADLIGECYSVYMTNTKFTDYNSKVQRTDSAEDRPAPGTSVLVPPNFMDLGNSYGYTAFYRAALAYKLLMAIAQIVYTSIEDLFKNDQLDQFNYAAMIVNNTLTLAYTTTMSIGVSPPRIEGAASLSMEYDGSIVIKTANKKTLYAETKTEGAAPVTMFTAWHRAALAASSIASKAPGVVSYIKGLCASK